MSGSCASSSFFFFFNDTATTEIYTLSLHDALPICPLEAGGAALGGALGAHRRIDVRMLARSEEHTSELQSQSNLVCRLLLEKKKKTYHMTPPIRHDPTCGTSPMTELLVHTTLIRLH